MMLTLMLAFTASAQNVLKGIVVEDGTNEPLFGATVTAESGEGTTTGADGTFQMSVKSLPVNVTFSYLGFTSKTLEVSSTEYLNIGLQTGIDLDDVVVVGSRFLSRTAINSPVAIDNIRADELVSTGKRTFDAMLNYAVPSFNSSQQTISDATAHFDPADLRGLGPSRTLVLINGKRKNPSALVYINDTPGKGEVGVDMKSIPASAIERVEVLRDGASAQYGSDAIAGVINIILKDDYEYTDMNVFSGITTEGDGFNIGYSLNTGVKLGEKGYLNLTTGYSDQKETNRAPATGKDLLFGNIFGDETLLNGTDPWLQANPTMGMHVGTPNMKTAEIFFNSSVELDENTELYAFGGLTNRDGKSYALYRTPYWITDDYGLLTEPGETYSGFQPTFETDIFDHTLVVGVKGEKKEWNYDISLASGGNSVDYTVDNSINPALGAQSPTNFNVGGYTFSHAVTNFDIGKQFGKVSLGLGTEVRKENFSARAGEEASYIDGGAQSFPGLQPQNEVNAVRYNFGMYADLNIDLTEDFLIGGTIRSENYSDFGNNMTYKVNSRFKTWDDKLVFRGSYSTGFRAPSLHQIYLSNVQTLVSGGTISNQGTFNNNSSVLRQLEVPKLTDEKAQNISLGVAAKPIDGLTLSFDYYVINVDDRIVYSSSIASDDTTTTVGKILRDNSITSLKFFVNAVSTKTTGMDFVASYNTGLGDGKLKLSAAANLNTTEIVGEVATPAPIKAAGVDLFDRKEQSRIISARPSNKILVGVGYELGKFNVNLNNTMFGEVTWQHATDPAKDQTFSAKWITDLYLSYRFSDKVGFSVAANNLLNVYPDVIDTKGDFVTDLGGRFQYPWEVNQFGFNGTTLSANLNIRF